MIKRMALLTRKPGMSREEFLRHWNDVHGPLVAQDPRVVKYLQDNVVRKERFVVRNADPDHPVPPDHAGPEVDGFVELWFEDREAMEAMYASGHAKALQADALRHIGTITTFTVEERTVVDRTPGPAQARGLAIDLSGRRIVITGAAGGIGKALAAGLGAAGAQIVAIDLRPEPLAALTAALSTLGVDAQGAVLDVCDRGACQALAADLAARGVRVDGLVNCAGLSVPRRVTDPDAPEAWDRQWSANATGVFNVTHAFVPALRQTRGAILNIGSVAARAGRGLNTAYQATKAAVTQMTRGWAVELAPDGIRVNALAPGIIETALSAHTRSDPERVARTLSRVPMARCGRPEELVGAAAFLLSPLAGYVTGAVLNVDGGFDAT